MVDSVAFSMAQRVARHNAAAADSWEAYAHELERELATELARNAAARALGAVAIEELSRIDPSNYLANKANRQRIYDEAYTKAVA